MVKEYSNASLPIGYQLNGEYTIERVLKMDSFCITYLANDISLSCHVVIREYFPKYTALREGLATVVPKSKNDEERYFWTLDRFVEEGRILARFNHLNIVRVLRLFEGVNNTAYQVMPYEEGQSLASYLEQHGPTLPEEIIKKIFVPILEGLREVHSNGLLHNDITPENIYLRANSSPMLINFDFGFYVYGDDLVELLPPSGYSAPEIYNFNFRGPWTDIYSVGANIYKCITGELPIYSYDRFQETGPYVSVKQKAYGKYSDNLLESVDAALKLSPKERPQTVGEFMRMLMD